jgi:N-acetylglucosaminyldiphosphoundecaprenol N-acetyl-beta-D-mannosaminyltransferase
MATATHYILGMKVHATSYNQSTETILGWAASLESRYVCVANVHMVMEAYDSESFRTRINRADLVTPDGMPLVWLLRRQGAHGATRVYGPDLTLHVLEASEKAGVPVGFLGGRATVLDALIEKLRADYPRLQVVYTHAPPFRPLTDEENSSMIQQIRESGARLLFVGLGCPKQESWMADNSAQLDVVMIGVGAAFDFLSNSIPQAPRWMMAAGLEWAFRFIQEPRRLWRRYLKHNSRFLILAGIGARSRSPSEDTR